jgi:hypothetical protein
MADHAHEQTDPGVVYENTIDGGKWGCKVIRTEPYVGQLTVWNIASGTVILDERVGLAYDAVFGPDVDDLAGWQGMILGSIDRQADINDRETT